MSVSCPARTPNWPSWPIASAGAVPCSERGSALRQRHGAEGRGFLRVFLGVQIAVHPAVAGALEAGRAAFHVVLRVEVRSRFVRRSARVHDREVPVLEPGLQRIHAGMEAEKSVEIQCAALRARSRDRDGRAGRVIGALPKRHDHVEAVCRTALEDGNQNLLAGLRGLCGARNERRRESETDEGRAAILEKDASSHHVEIPDSSLPSSRSSVGAPTPNRLSPALRRSLPAHALRSSVGAPPPTARPGASAFAARSRLAESPFLKFG
jgi:hypothetical protein